MIKDDLNEILDIFKSNNYDLSEKYSLIMRHYCMIIYRIDLFKKEIDINDINKLIKLLEESGNYMYNSMVLLYRHDNSKEYNIKHILKMININTQFIMEQLLQIQFNHKIYDVDSFYNYFSFIINNENPDFKFIFNNKKSILKIKKKTDNLQFTKKINNNIYISFTVKILRCLSAMLYYIYKKEKMYNLLKEIEKPFCIDYGLYLNYKLYPDTFINEGKNLLKIDYENITYNIIVYIPCNAIIDNNYNITYKLEETILYRNIIRLNYIENKNSKNIFIFDYVPASAILALIENICEVTIIFPYNMFLLFLIKIFIKKSPINMDIILDNVLENKVELIQILNTNNRNKIKELLFKNIHIW